MKDQARVLGIDDGPFEKGQARAQLAGVLVRPPGYVEGVMISSCQVDGDDANEAISSMVKDSRFSEQVRMVMVDGAALGGFNVVDVRALSEEIGVPVLTISRDEPNLTEIIDALRAHFPDWERRFEVISRNRVRPLEVPDGRVYVTSEGIGEKEADAMVRQCIVRGCLPEPVRLAHLIATALVRGESRGRA
ncbi:MAG TPA: DUF99 family protein [Methanomassiliicoccales archaeon]|nr:DUF99 family protein [Methanomassiliicoccales archaeon]HNX47475.1 DUF99 family protein [Methanomassiliicoccales archaeon]HPR98230.1 DUF99 family protein [Methanomassiliicoccales archaeon]HSA35385.1 DUF99 family protein [Methanomassiliicoccales archaeon]